MAADSECSKGTGKGTFADIFGAGLRGGRDALASQLGTRPRLSSSPSPSPSPHNEGCHVEEAPMDARSDATSNSGSYTALMLLPVMMAYAGFRRRACKLCGEWCDSDSPLPDSSAFDRYGGFRPWMQCPVLLVIVKFSHEP